MPTRAAAGDMLASRTHARRVSRWHAVRSHGQLGAGARDRLAARGTGGPSDGDSGAGVVKEIRTRVGGVAGPDRTPYLTQVSAREAVRTRMKPNEEGQRSLAYTGSLVALAAAATAAPRGPARSRGSVRIDGACPRLAAAKVAKDASICGAEQASEAVTASDDGGLRNVVVSLHAVKPPAPAAPPPPGHATSTRWAACTSRTSRRSPWAAS